MLSILVTETAINEIGKHNLFNNIFYKLKNNKIEFKILTFNSKEAEKVHSHRTLKPEVIITKISSFLILNNFFLFYKLVRLKPDHLIIGGYGYIQSWVSLIYVLLFGAKATLWTGASAESTLNKNIFYFFMKSLFIKKFDNAIVYGTKAFFYLKKLGFKKKILLAKNISDIEFFNKMHHKKTSYSTKPIFIYCGRLVKHKGIEYLLETFQRFDNNKYELLIAGDGPLKTIVNSKINSRKINASYLGQLNQNNLAKVLKKADYFISPSFNDPFSRILSEAIASGCFCISSIYDDASSDLIKMSNGITYDPQKKNALFNILSNIFNNPKILRLNRKSYKIINYNTNRYSSEYSSLIIELLNET